MLQIYEMINLVSKFQGNFVSSINKTAINTLEALLKIIKIINLTT